MRQVLIILFSFLTIVSYGQDNKDVFLTVQIGAYYREVGSNELFGITPFKLDLTEDGLYRYYSGEYKTLEAAKEAKNSAINKGVYDAFITGYKGEERITVEEALRLLGEPPLPDGPVVTDSPPDPPEDLEILYSVQIGPYMESMPAEEVNIVLRMAGKGFALKKILDEEGRSIYSIGQLQHYEEAMELKEAIVEEGVWNAVEIAFINGELSDFYEAIELASDL